MKRKILSRAAAILVIILLVALGAAALNFCLVDDTASYTRLMEHELYGQEGIDILFLGPSHCYRGVDPAVVSEKTGKRVFNASCASQPLDGSLALLREAVKYYDLQEVYLEVNAESVQNAGVFKERTNLTSVYLVSDYMRPSLNRLNFLLHASSSEHYMNSFFRARRYWREIFDLKSVLRLVRLKLSAAYTGFAYDLAASEDEQYRGLGYVSGSGAVAEHGHYSKEPVRSVDLSAVSDDWKAAMGEIIEVCRSHQIKLTVFGAPVSGCLLASRGNYDAYIEFMRAFLKGTNVTFAEFNLLREEYFPDRQDYFKDVDHLNSRGAEVFSAVLSQDINGQLPASAFHQSVEDRLGNAPPTYYGILFQDDEAAKTRTLCLIASQPDWFEYRVETESGQVLQDYDTNSTITVPLALVKDGEGLVVSFRQLGETGDGQSVVYRDPQE